MKHHILKQIWIMDKLYTNWVAGPSSVVWQNSGGQATNSKWRDEVVLATNSSESKKSNFQDIFYTLGESEKIPNTFLYGI